MPLWLLIACGLGPVAADSQIDVPAPTPGAVNVLFIGNSLTYTNDLPGIVQALADSLGTGPIRTGMVALPDYSLGDHWLEGTARRAIAAGGWQVVAMQQGPSTLDASRRQLIADARRFADAIRASGAEPAMLQVWPLPGYSWDRALETYALAADSIQGALLPAGAALRAAQQADPALTLFTDGFHPNAAGSYLAALVIVARLTGADLAAAPPVLRTPRGAGLDVSSFHATLLAAAGSALGQAAMPGSGRR